MLQLRSDWLVVVGPSSQGGNLMFQLQNRVLVGGLSAVAIMLGLPTLASAQRYKTIATIAGSGETGPPVAKGMSLDMPLSNPFGVVPEGDGSLIVASYDQHVIYRLDAAYKRMSIIAGTGEADLLGKDGDHPTRVALRQPHEVQVDEAGNIFIADTGNHRVGMIQASSGRWRSVAGTGQAGFSGDGNAAVDARLDQAYSIAVSGQELFIADLGNHRIRRVDLTTGNIQTICGTGEKKLPEDGGRAIDQPLFGPRSLAVDDANLWIVLREGNSVWRISRQDNRIYRVAGSGDKGFSGDGANALRATFRGPKGIAVDPAVALFIADTENHAIRRIDLISGRISTLVGATGTPGFDGDGNGLERRQLNRPHGVCLLPDGDLLIGDSENHRLRILAD